MNRNEALAQAVAAAGRAQELARSAEADLTHPTAAHHVPKVAAVGTLYTDLSRTYLALAGVLPETTEESSRG